MCLYVKALLRHKLEALENYSVSAQRETPAQRFPWIKSKQSVMAVCLGGGVGNSGERKVEAIFYWITSNIFSALRFASSRGESYIYGAFILLDIVLGALYI